jgi:hypothetical protein
MIEFKSYYQFANAKNQVIDIFIKSVLFENNIKKIPNKFVKINEQEEKIWLTYKNKRLKGTLIFEYDTKNFCLKYKIID